MPRLRIPDAQQAEHGPSRDLIAHCAETASLSALRALIHDTQQPADSFPSRTRDKEHCQRNRGHGKESKTTLITLIDIFS